MYISGYICVYLYISGCCEHVLGVLWGVFTSSIVLCSPRPTTQQNKIQHLTIVPLIHIFFSHCIKAESISVEALVSLLVIAFYQNDKNISCLCIQKNWHRFIIFCYSSIIQTISCCIHNHFFLLQVCSSPLASTWWENLMRKLVYAKHERHSWYLFPLLCVFQQPSQWHGN